MQIWITCLPDLLFIDDVNTGSTALDGLPAFLNFNSKVTVVQQTTKSTNVDKAMTKITRGLIF